MSSSPGVLSASASRSAAHDHLLPCACAFSLRSDGREKASMAPRGRHLRRPAGGERPPPASARPPQPPGSRDAPGGVVRIVKIRNGPFLILPIRDMPPGRVVLRVAPDRACAALPASTQTPAVPQSPLFRMGMSADERDTIRGRQQVDQADRPQEPQGARWSGSAGSPAFSLLAAGEPTASS